MSDTPDGHEHAANKLRIRPYTHGDFTKVVSAAQQDNHGVLRPSHVVEKGGKVVGALELGTVPLVMTWMHTKETKIRDTLRVKDFFENMAGVGAFILPCSVTSPYAPFLEKHGKEEGYTCLGVYKLYVRKGQ